MGESLKALFESKEILVSTKLANNQKWLCYYTSTKSLVWYFITWQGLHKYRIENWLGFIVRQIWQILII